jgi:hypothetical protein
MLTGKGNALNAADVHPGNFKLPQLGEKLKQLAGNLHNGNGPGFFVLRGLEPLKNDPTTNLFRHLGISSYIGDLRAKQDIRGNMVGT